MEIGERRLFERMRIDFPAKFVNDNEDIEMKAFCWDFSAGGACVYSNDIMRPKQKLKIWMQIPNRYDSIPVDAEVVWSTQSQPGIWKVGLQFLKIRLLNFWPILRYYRQQNKEEII